MGYIKMIIGTAAFAAAVLIMPAIPAKAADGWQQDSAQEWVYVEHDKKLVNQWVLWPDGTMRYVGDNGRIAADRWVNVGEARYRVRADGSRYENEWFSLVSKPAVPEIGWSSFYPSHRCPQPPLSPAGTTREMTESF